MANPVLNQRTLQNQTAWAPPAVAPDVARDSRVAAGDAGVMTLTGTIVKSALLMAVVIAVGAFVWTITPDAEVGIDGSIQMSPPPFLTISAILGFGLVMLLYFKPHLAVFVAPGYAVVQGYFVGSLSKYYEAFYDGIVLQAIGATVAVFLAVLGLYASRVIRVTSRMRSIIVSATVGLMVFYGISLLFRLFGFSIPFLNESSGLGILFSVFVSFVAAANLLLDFDIIERGVAQRFNKGFEWYAAFGLLVTIVWLYLEILRLLAKLRSR